MKEDNKVIKTNSLLYEEIAVCNCESCTPTPSNCCCNVTETVSFDTCTDTIKSITISPNIVCSGKLLIVKVNLRNVCCPSNVTVAVVVCDSRTGNLLRLGVKTVSIASTVTCTESPTSTATIPCTATCVPVDDVVEFCFAFEDVCTAQTFTVKAIANYSITGVTCPPCPTTPPGLA